MVLFYWWFLNPVQVADESNIRRVNNLMVIDMQLLNVAENVASNDTHKLRYPHTNGRFRFLFEAFVMSE